jgi:hypothetical protein
MQVSPRYVARLERAMRSTQLLVCDAVLSVGLFNEEEIGVGTESGVDWTV